ncbi:hypothetical protein ACGFX4_38580, partial [Kitasatospora sp. NPDC048365]
MNVGALLADLQTRQDEAIARAAELRARIEELAADQAFRARELHELLGMPTDEASVNITRSRLGRLARQGFLTQRPLAGATKKSGGGGGGAPGAPVCNPKTIVQKNTAATDCCRSARG